MKRKILIAGMLCLVTLLSACGVVAEKPQAVQSNEISSVQQSTKEQSQTNTQNTKVTKETIEKQVLLDENGIKITAKSIEKMNGNLDLNLLIENNSDKNITVQARNESINDIMIDGIFSCDVSSGKKANDEISFSSRKLDKCGIKTIKDIELSFNIFNSDDFMDDILETPLSKITTSVDENFKQSYNDKGTVILEQNGIKVVGQELTKDDYGDTKLMLYIENNTEKNITVQSRDVSVNGFMISPIFSCDVCAGKKAYDDISFSERKLTENDIDKISKIQISLHIFGDSFGSTILESQPITIEFE